MAFGFLGVQNPIQTNGFTASGGDGTVGTGSAVYVPFYSFSGGELTDVEFYASYSSSTPVAFGWSVYAHSASGGVGAALAPTSGWGTFTVVPSDQHSGNQYSDSGWFRANLQVIPSGDTWVGPTLEPNRYYLFAVSCNVGFTWKAPSVSSGVWEHLWAPPHVLLRYQSGAWLQLESPSYRYWAFRYFLGGAWYGQPFTNSATFSSVSAAGISLRLPSQALLYGAILNIGSTSGGPVTVLVYEVGTDFLPSGSAIYSLSTYTTPAVGGGQVYVHFGSGINVQNFAVVVSGSSFTPNYLYTDSTRFQSHWGFARGVYRTNTSWYVLSDSPNSGSLGLYTSVIPIFSISSGASTSPVGLVPATFRGVER